MLFPKTVCTGRELRYEQYLEQVNNGAMFVSNPDQVAENWICMIEDLGLDRFSCTYLWFWRLMNKSWELLNLSNASGSKVGLFCHERDLIKIPIKFIMTAQ